MQSPELQARIAVWKQKALADTLTIEEMREAVAAMRQGRLGAVTAAASKRSTSRGPAMSADAMLDELKGL